MDNRRRFERLGLEGAIALDDQGCELGFVNPVGGGGMGINLKPEFAALDWQPGTEMHVTVLEPESNLRHAVTVVVRYLHNGQLGVSFVTAPTIRT